MKIKALWPFSQNSVTTVLQKLIYMSKFYNFRHEKQIFAVMVVIYLIFLLKQ